MRLQSLNRQTVYRNKYKNKKILNKEIKQINLKYLEMLHEKYQAQPQGYLRSF